MNRYPKLPGLSDAKPDPVLGEMVNYQTDQYALGSINHPYEASTCMVYASAWWNDSRAQVDATLGSPKRFATLYPHYVFNGAAFMDRTELYFENRPEQSIRDEWTRSPGPWMREFAERGRAGTLQYKNTLLCTYSGRNRGPDDVRPVANKLHRVSASMFLFRWQPGLEGLSVDRESVTQLPLELNPGDWWFIEDGQTYVGVRPLEATHLRGLCKTTLEQRTRQIVLYQDNYVGETIEGVTDEQWVKARSGFVIEMGDAAEYGSFERFRDVMLKARVNESSDGFIRYIEYQRPGRQLELKWHCYKEDYLVRRIDGKDHHTVRHFQSPEFAVGTTDLHTHDARLTTRSSETIWLLSAAPSRTYVAYQPNPHRQLPLRLETPFVRIESERFPFGKLAVSRISGGTLELTIDAGFRPFWSGAHWRASIWQDIGTHPSDIYIRTDAAKVTAVINGDEMPVVREVRKGEPVWVLDPYARLPRVRDRVRSHRPVGSQGQTSASK